jgi:hypothetical protein
VLDSGSSTDLSSNVGKRVEVTGMLENNSTSSTSPGTTGTASGTASGTSGSTSGTTSASNAPRIRVSSVRVIGSDCSGSGK